MTRSNSKLKFICPQIKPKKDDWEGKIEKHFIMKYLFILRLSITQYLVFQFKNRY